MNQSHGRLQETVAPGIEKKLISAKMDEKMGGQVVREFTIRLVKIGSLNRSEERLIDQLKEPPASQHAGGEMTFFCRPYEW